MANMNGRYFIEFMLHAFYTIIDSMHSVWSFVTKEIVIDWNIAGIPVYYEAGYSMLEFMLFGGIIAYLTFIVVKFFLDIVF